MGRYDHFYKPYVSVEEKRAKAEKKRKKLQKKDPNIKPIIIEGNVLAKSWWGKEWNNNLESYADYYNRLQRGRSYLRHGCVLDFQIVEGTVSAKVAGSGRKIYSVDVNIKGVSKFVWSNILDICGKKLDSLQELLIGNFPSSLKELFVAEEYGLFPTMEEIHFSCTCPDGAFMCKHVAAVLYGVGARLDENPKLFFTLRGANVNDLIKDTVESSASKLLKKAKKKSSKIIKDENLSEIFGIEMDDRAKPKTKGTLVDVVVKVIKRYKKGVKVAQIIKKTNLSEMQVYNAIARARKQNKIKSIGFGLYKYHA